MSHVLPITSAQNPKIKEALKLWDDARTRRKLGMFVAEGAREILRAVACGYELVHLFVCEEMLSELGRKTWDAAAQSQRELKVLGLPQELFAKLAVRKDSDGVYGVFYQKEIHFKDLNLPENPLVLILDKVEKPGNLGAIIRAADGSGVSAVILVGDGPSPFSPQSIRASLGTVFSVPVVSTTHEEALKFCREKQIRVYGAALKDHSQSYTKFSYAGPTAFVLGSEAFGVGEFWLKACDHLIIIPMLGIADSLNVSVAGAILVYEALRQR